MNENDEEARKRGVRGGGGGGGDLSCICVEDGGARLTSSTKT